MGKRKESKMRNDIVCGGEQGKEKEKEKKRRLMNRKKYEIKNAEERRNHHTLMCLICILYPFY